jgi:hypothetical protein
MNLHCLVHEDVACRVLSLLPVPNLVSLPLDDELRTQSLNGVVVDLVIYLLRCDLSNGKEGPAHGVLVEGGGLLGMTGEARSIADITDFGMNVAIRPLVAEARVKASMLGGFGQVRFHSKVGPDSVDDPTDPKGE